MRVIVCVAALLTVVGCVGSTSAKGVQSAQAAGPMDGQQLFNRRCGGCHALDRSKEGPQLRGVYGRKAGSVAGFDYSDALKKSGITWADAMLDRWLTDTDAVVSGNGMDFSVKNKEERAAIISFLKSDAAR